MDYDMLPTHSSSLVIGTGCMPNCNFALINAGEGHVSRDDMLLKLQFDHVVLQVLSFIDMSNLFE